MSAYDKSKVESRKKKLSVQMESHLFNNCDPIYIFDILQTFKRACNTLSIHKGAAIFLFYHFMKRSAKQDLLHRIKGGSNDGTDDDELSDGALRCYDEVVNYLPLTMKT